jgi:hypothetical protein
MGMRAFLFAFAVIIWVTILDVIRRFVELLRTDGYRQHQ